MIIKEFKFDYKGYEVRCLKENRTGIYIKAPVWNIVFKGFIDFNHLTKVEAKKDTIKWVKLKAISIIDKLLEVPKVEHEFSWLECKEVN